MTEQDLIEKISRANENIEQLDAQHEATMIPLRNEVRELTKDYSRLFSPLKAGDRIPYQGGIVQIINATCTQIPEKWQYEAKILSVGDDNGPDAFYIGRHTRVDLNRWQTPNPLP